MSMGVQNESKTKSIKAYIPELLKDQNMTIVEIVVAVNEKFSCARNRVEEIIRALRKEGVLIIRQWDVNKMRRPAAVLGLRYDNPVLNKDAPIVTLIVVPEDRAKTHYRRKLDFAVNTSTGAANKRWEKARAEKESPITTKIEDIDE